MSENNVRWLLEVAYNGTEKEQSQVQMMLVDAIKARWGRHSYSDVEQKISQLEQYYVQWVKSSMEVNDVVVHRIMELIN